MTAKELHRRAMELMDEAEALHREAIAKMCEAQQLEVHAGTTSEPGKFGAERGRLYRSAAWIAVWATKFDAAIATATLGLMVCGDGEVRRELEQVARVAEWLKQNTE